jgi:hypothetical protein
MATEVGRGAIHANPREAMSASVAPSSNSLFN